MVKNIVLMKSDVIDNLSSTDKDKPLSASQGNTLKNIFDEYRNQINPSIIPYDANLVKSSKDSNGVYLKYTWELSKVITGMPAKWVSELSTDYTTRTLTVYDSDKTTVISTVRFTRTLDEDGSLISEILA